MIDHLPTIETVAARERRIKELRHELRSLGYVSIAKDHVARFQARHIVTAGDLAMFGGDKSFVDRIIRDLAHKLGVGLVEASLVRIENLIVPGHAGARAFAASVECALPDPLFDVDPQFAERIREWAKQKEATA